VASKSTVRARYGPRDACSTVLRAPLARPAHHLLAFIPERLGILRIQGISAPSLADDADDRGVSNDAADMAILEIAPADFVRRSDHGGPYRGGGSLRNRLPLVGGLALGGELLVDLLDH